MVNDAATTVIPGTAPADARGAERALALGYAPAAARGAAAAMLALDDTMARILRTTREPLIGQMRLTWWRDALTALDTAPPPAEPVLRALAEAVLPRGVTGEALAAMTDGWEALLYDPPDHALFAEARGATLFRLLARVAGQEAGGDARIVAAGRGWALADLAQNLSDPALARTVAVMAARELSATPGGWPRAWRMLGALAWLAADDLRADAVPGSPRRVARLALLRLTGR